MLHRPFDQHFSDTPLSESDVLDIKSVVFGLVKVFTIKIHRLPSIHAMRIYKMLVTHLEYHYSKPKMFEECHQIRYKVFICNVYFITY